MLHEHLDDSILLLIFCKLSPSALAAAELVCRCWSTLINTAEIWKQHAECCDSFAGSCSNRPDRGRVAAAVTHLSLGITWRDICLHRAAATKWSNGHLKVSATLPGHTGPVTCMAVLHNVVITGSNDGTSRLWDLQQGVMLHTLPSPGGEPVLAVALPSVNLALTVTAKGGAVLWRAGAAIRRFETLPGDKPACIALTDTQLLLGGSSGIVQHFDLFSGRRQLITKHSSGVTCIRVLKQQHKQHHALPGDPEDSIAIIGCMDGQVSCITTVSGRLLWKLPVPYPARVVSLEVVEWLQGVHGCGGEQQQQPHLNCERIEQLLFVLNARSQLVCWQLPRLAAPTADPRPQTRANTYPLADRSRCTNAASISSKTAETPSVTGNTAIGREISVPAVHPSHSHWKIPRSPSAVCHVAAQTADESAAAESQSGSSPGHVQEPPEGSRTYLRRFTHNTSTSLLSPLLGKNCLLIGSSLGYVTAVQFGDQNQVCTAGHSDLEADAAQTGQVGEHHVQGIVCHHLEDSGNLATASTSAADGTPLAADGIQNAAQEVKLSAAAAAPRRTVAGGVHARDQATISRTTATSKGTWHCLPLQQQQHTSRSRVALSITRHHSLMKLGKILAKRQIAAAAASCPSSRANACARAASTACSEQQPGHRSQPVITSGVHSSVDSQETQAQGHLQDFTKVVCMQFTQQGQLLVGLGSGHVCCLTSKHPIGTRWA